MQTINSPSAARTFSSQRLTRADPEPQYAAEAEGRPKRSGSARTGFRYGIARVGDGGFCVLTPNRLWSLIQFMEPRKVTLTRVDKWRQELNFEAEDIGDGFFRDENGYEFVHDPRPIATGAPQRNKHKKGQGCDLCDRPTEGHKIAARAVDPNEPEGKVWKVCGNCYKRWTIGTQRG